MSATQNPVIKAAQDLAQRHNLIIRRRFSAAGQVIRWSVLRRMPTCDVFVGKAVSPSALLALVRRAARVEGPVAQEKEAAL